MNNLYTFLIIGALVLFVLWLMRCPRCGRFFGCGCGRHHKLHKGCPCGCGMQCRCPAGCPCGCRRWN